MESFPLEFALIGFEGNKFSGLVVPELLDLAERGIVRYVDIVFIQKDADGSTRTVELNDLDQESYKIFVPMGRQVESLFSEEDLELAASKLPNNCSAALLLWENLWTENIRKALIASGGMLVERGHIFAEVVEEVRQMSPQDKA
jgi:hypothetical protein